MGYKGPGLNAAYKSSTYLKRRFKVYVKWHSLIWNKESNLSEFKKKKNFFRSKQKKYDPLDFCDLTKG